MVWEVIATSLNPVLALEKILTAEKGNTAANLGLSGLNPVLALEKILTFTGSFRPVAGNRVSIQY